MLRSEGQIEGPCEVIGMMESDSRTQGGQWMRYNILSMQRSSLGNSARLNGAYLDQVAVIPKAISSSSSSRSIYSALVHTLPSQLGEPRWISGPIS